MKNFWKNEDYQTQRIFVVLITLILGLIIYNIYSHKHIETSFKKSFKTWAIISEMSHGTYKIPSSINFYFFNTQGKKIEILNSDPIDCFNFRKEKDTIYIRYSTTDNYVAEIIHCFWNDKLREDMINQSK